MKRVFNELHKRGVHLSDFSCLEVFGGYGVNTVSKYAQQVKALEIWEIRPECKESLKRKAPEALVKTVDSYKAIKQSKNKYDLIVVDDNKIIIMTGNHYEHFDLFPDLFNLMESHCILIVNVCPEMTQCSLNHYERRRRFYKTMHPDNIPMNYMVEIYNQLALNNGFKVNWSFTYLRNNGVHYLVLSLTKN